MELMEGGSWQSNDINHPSQSVDEILSIVQEARQPAELGNQSGVYLGGSMDFEFDDVDADVDVDDIESSGEFVCPV